MGKISIFVLALAFPAARREPAGVTSTHEKRVLIRIVRGFQGVQMGT